MSVSSLDLGRPRGGPFFLGALSGFVLGFVLEEVPILVKSGGFSGARDAPVQPG